MESETGFLSTVIYRNLARLLQSYQGKLDESEKKMRNRLNSRYSNFSYQQLTESVPAENVKGLGFDATCSLAVCDADGNPVSVDLEG